MKSRGFFILFFFLIFVSCKAFEEKSEATPTPTLIPAIIVKGKAPVVNFSDNKHFIKDMVLLDDSHLLFVGSTNSTDEKNQNIYILLTSNEHKKIWDKIYGDTTDSIAKTVYQTKSGEIYIAGTSNNKLFIMQIDHLGKIIWQKNFDEIYSDDNAINLSESIEGGIIAVSCKVNGSYGNPYSIKLNNTGGVIWETIFQSNSKIQRFYYPTGVVIDDNSYLVTSKVDNYSILLRVKEPDGRWTAGTAFECDGSDADLNVEKDIDSSHCTAVPFSILKCKEVILSPMECKAIADMGECGIYITPYPLYQIYKRG
jgi:hypothetical protein